MVMRKDQLEESLHEEKNLIDSGILKEDNPLDFSEQFTQLCNACRKGDLKVCQEAIMKGANINGRDEYDYTPLILASLCGHYEVVQLLLESGALCERDTFQGERCLYNALNDRIRNLLLSYDYSKSTDQLQPLAAHITSLLFRDSPQTSDIIVSSSEKSFALHKFILAARSPFFSRKLSKTPGLKHLRLSESYPSPSFEIAVRYLYFGEIPNDIRDIRSIYPEEQVLRGIERISRQLEIGYLWDAMLVANSGSKRLARQQRGEETERGRNEIDVWFRENVVGERVYLDATTSDEIKLDRTNRVYADVLLRAYDMNEDTPALPSTSCSRSVIFPAHRAILLRSEYFLAMFSSTFLEAQVETPNLHIITVDCTPDVLEAVLTYLYTERADFGLNLAIDVLFASDFLFIERLKSKSAQIISTLGSGVVPGRLRVNEDDGDVEDNDEDPLDPFSVLNAAYELRVPRLEEFAARYLAYRLEKFIETPEFLDAIAKSAARIKNRQETDSIELIDDIRYFLSERFRLRFEGDGLEEMLGDNKNSEDVGGEMLDSEAVAQKLAGGEFRTFDGEIAGDEFASDTINYQLLLGKIDALLERLQLDG